MNPSLRPGAHASVTDHSAAQPPPPSLGPNAVLLLVPAIAHVSALYAVAMVNPELHLRVSSAQASPVLAAEAARSILSTIAAGIPRATAGVGARAI